MPSAAPYPQDLIFQFSKTRLPDHLCPLRLSNTSRRRTTMYSTRDRANGRECKTSLATTPTMIINHIKAPSLHLATTIALIAAVGLLANGAANVRSPIRALESTSSSNQQQALNYLLFSSSSRQPHDLRLEGLLKDSNHSHVSDAVNLQLANSVWKKMRQNALEFAQQRADETKPTINRLLEQSNVSAVCQQSINDAIDRLAKLDEWAVRSK